MGSDSLPNFFINEEVDLLLISIAKKEGFKNFSFEFESGSCIGDGYVAKIISLKVTERNNNQKCLYLIIKLDAISEYLRKRLPIVDVFVREIYMYDEVFPLLKSMEIEHGLCEPNFAPKIYGSLISEKQEALVLQNLKKDGFRLLDRSKEVDEEHIKFVLTNFARFHATSFALRDQKSDVFEEKIESMENMSIKIRKGIFGDGLILDCKNCLKSLDPAIDQEAIVAYEAFLENLDTTVEEIFSFPVDQNSVVVHGDAWAGNMMFKYEDEENPSKPTELCCLDFQIANLGSLIYDLTYFIFAYGTKAVIDNCDEYLDLYYNTLASYVTKLGSDPQKVYPKATFESEWKRFAKWALFISPHTIRSSLSGEDEIVDLESIATSELKDLSTASIYEIKNDKLLNERIRDVVLYFVNNNLL